MSKTNAEPKNQVKEITRAIPRSIENELWGRAAGRCEFDGCNRILYRSSVTRDRVNIAEKAHIYSFSEQGARGQGVFSKKKRLLNSIENLMLLCHDCHKLIDADKEGIRYSADLLREWKQKHEERVEIVTGISPLKKTHVIIYGANIGQQESVLQPQAVMQALFPEWYPDSDRPTELSMNWFGEDCDYTFWETELKNLQEAFSRVVEPSLTDKTIHHVSLFAHAPIPLLTALGVMITDKCDCRVYQLHREPVPSWKWYEDSTKLGFKIVEPKSISGRPVLALSLSDSIDRSRIARSLSGEMTLWEITVDSPNNDLIKSESHLSQFRKVLRECIVRIGQRHGKNTPIRIFPAIPVSCALELGRVRMPKADGEWIIFDYNLQLDGFSPILRVNHGLSICTPKSTLC